MSPLNSEQEPDDVEADLEIVVCGGPDLGARTVLGAEVIVVGRGRAADLRLSDLTVSRRHLELRRVDGAADVRVVDGAASIRHAGESCEACTLVVGDKLVVGSTVIALVASETARVAQAQTALEVTDVRTLLGGGTVKEPALGSIFVLSEALDGSRDEVSIQAALGRWVTARLGASAVVMKLKLEPGETATEQLVERSLAQGRHQVTVPLVGLSHEALVFEVDLASRLLCDDTRRLLVVAGRLTASSLIRMRSMDRVTTENRELRRIAYGSARSFLGSTPEAEAIAKVLVRLAASNAIALIVGETGSGKSFLARLIHEAGPRASEPSRVINCAAIPENLLEAELFGHEKGAFTGAAGARAGALEAVGEGTVLLDEIGDLPLTSQAKLLHVLEARVFQRLGSNRSIPLRARILVATNRPLKQMVAEGSFRSDLYYRISVVTVEVPPLRVRQDDIAMLADRFLADLGPSCGRRVTGISPAAIEVLKSYPWPGNVRELRNVIEHALVLGDGPVIEPADWPAEVQRSTGVSVTSAGHDLDESDRDLVQLPLDLATLEERAIAAALRATEGNRTRAAALLGINRVTLYKKLRAKDQEPS
ncbi:MAG: sigma 54-dependent Fis family transcriptional regulator [Polyangiaceae bacterium]